MKKLILLILLVISYTGYTQVNFTQGFESPSLPSGWTVGAVPYSISTVNPIAGSRSFVFNIPTTGQAGPLTSPAFTSNGNAIQVSFSSKETGSSQVYYNFRYQVGSNPSVPLNSTTSTNGRIASMNAVTNTYTIPAGVALNTSDVKFSVEAFQSPTTPPTSVDMYIDNFVATQSLAATPTITAISAINITGNSADINYNLGITSGSATSIIRYGTTSNSLNSNVTGSSATSGNTIGATTISGLNAGTLYYYLVEATSSGGIVQSAVQTFTTTAAAAGIAFSSLNATAITSTTATLNVTLSSVCPGSGYRLQYSTTSSFGAGTVEVLYSTNGSNGIKSHPITGLLANTAYFFRFYSGANEACNPTQTVSTTANFSTSGPISLPTISNVASANIAATTATVNYSLNANNGATTSVVRYGLSSGSLSNSVTASGASGNTTISGTAQLTALTPNTQYFYQVEATNSAGTVSSAVLSFTTAASAGIIEFSNLTSSFVTTTTATVSVTLANVCANSNYRLQYSTSSTFASGTVDSAYPTNGTSGVKNHNLTGLDANTTYYFRFYASVNQACNPTQIVSVTESFTTATTTTNGIIFSNLSSSAINATSATVSVTLSNVCANSTYQLQYSTSASFAAGTIDTQFMTNGTNGVKDHNLTGLAPNTTYYFRFYAAANQACNTTQVISSSSSFSTTNTNFAFSNLTSSSVANTIATVSVTLSNVCAGSTYQLQYSTSPAFGAGTVDIQFATGGTSGVKNHNLNTLLPSTTYYYRFYANANQACNTTQIISVTESFTTTNTPPLVIQFSNLTSSAVTNTTATLSVTLANVCVASTYQLQYSPSASFSAGTVDTQYVTNGTDGVKNHNLTGLSPNSTYYFRFYAATNQACNTSQVVSVTSSFVTTNATPITPTFTQIAPICAGETLSALPLTSNNGILGSWLPAINSSTTTTYTFTPNSGQNATTTTMTIVVGTTKTWSGSPGSWSPSAPTSIDAAVISSNYAAIGILSACSLTVNNNAIAVFPTGTSVSVSNAVTVIPGSSFVLENDANLIQTSNASNSGDITVKRNSSNLYRQDYTLWSSPVVGQNLRNFSPQTLFNRFYSYSEPTGVYVQELVTTADVTSRNFAIGKGYLIRMPNNWAEYVSSATPGTSFIGTFTGVPANGDITVPLSITNQKYNLVGNPYPSSISISSFLANNSNLVQNLYFWRKRNGAIGSGFATWSTLGVVSAQAETNNAVVSNTIKSGQGFFIRSNTASNVFFNNSMRTSIIAATTFFKGSTASNKATNSSRIWINLKKDQEQVGQTLVGYSVDANNGIDEMDAIYFNDSELALTSLINGEEYAIQGRNNFATADVIPLGFKTDLAGTYVISLSNFDGIFETNQAIYLKDNATGLETNLKTTDYPFISPTGVFNSRFELRFESTLSTNGNAVLDNTVYVISDNGNIAVRSLGNAIEKIDIFDLSGRLVFTKSEINNTNFEINKLTLANQVLLVKVTTNDKKTQIKKIIF
jgi:phosphodiesterase/alkaline phosphatase D-like protein